MSAWSKQEYKCGDCAFLVNGKCEILYREVSPQKNACGSFEEK